MLNRTRVSSLHWPKNKPLIRQQCLVIESGFLGIYSKTYVACHELHAHKWKPKSPGIYMTQWQNMMAQPAQTQNTVIMTKTGKIHTSDLMVI